MCLSLAFLVWTFFIYKPNYSGRECILKSNTKNGAQVGAIVVMQAIKYLLAHASLGLTTV